MLGTQLCSVADSTSTQQGWSLDHLGDREPRPHRSTHSITPSSVADLSRTVGANDTDQPAPAPRLVSPPGLAGG